MKRLLTFSLAFLLVFTGPVVSGGDNLFPRFSPTKDFGRSVWSAETHRSTIAYDRAGNPELVYSTQGGYFYAIDFTTGEIKFEQQLSGPYIYCNAADLGTDGKVYFKTYPETGMRTYNPITQTVSDFPEFQSDGNIAYVIKNGPDGKLHLSTYDSDGAKVYEYDFQNKTTVNLGVMKEGAHYIQGMDVTPRYIYCGVGVGQPIQACIRYDRETGEKKEIFGQQGGGTFYQVMVADGKIYALQFGRVLVYDEETLEQVDSFVNDGRTFISRPHPKNKDLIYNIYNKDLYEYNVATKVHQRVSVAPIPEAATLGLNSAGWAELPSGDWAMVLYTNFMSHVGYFNTETRENFVFKLDKIADAGPAVQSLEISPEGIAYIGGYQTGTSAFHTETEEFLFNIQEWHQNEGVGFLNGKVYYGVYTDAVIFRYDPQKPLNYLGYNYDRKYQPDGNPGMVYDIEENQDRPFVVKGFGDKLYIGTMPGYAQLGGALVIYEEDEDGTPHAEVFRHVVEDQSITGIAYRDGKVYLSSTIRGGLGIEYTQSQAKIAVFDEATKKVVQTVIPDVPVIGTASQTIGEISFGPDGLLWACSELGGTVFAMDPETFEVVKYVQLTPGKDLNPLARPLYIRWGDDGKLYTTAGWNVTVIDPETMEHQRITPNTSLMTLDPNGNVWYAKGGSIFKTAVNQYDRLQLFLKTLQTLSAGDYTSEDWNTLQQKITQAQALSNETADEEIIQLIHEIKAVRDGEKPLGGSSEELTVLLDGEKVLFDEFLGKPLLHQSRTMLPFRKLFELFGFQIDWNGITQTVTAVAGESTITLVVGNNHYVINGETIEFDVAPVLLEGRTYVPVRVIAEAMGYEVGWEESSQTVTITTGGVQ